MHMSCCYDGSLGLLVSVLRVELLDQEVPQEREREMPTEVLDDLGPF